MICPECKTGEMIRTGALTIDYPKQTVGNIVYDYDCHLRCNNLDCRHILLHYVPHDSKSEQLLHEHISKLK